MGNKALTLITVNIFIRKGFKNNILLLIFPPIDIENIIIRKKQNLIGIDKKISKILKKTPMYRYKFSNKTNFKKKPRKGGILLIDNSKIINWVFFIVLFILRILNFLRVIKNGSNKRV